MSAETKAFALQKKWVMFWRGEVFLNRRAREKEKERGASKTGSVEGPESARLGQSADALGMTMPKA